jgi:CRP/FNR family transcriptional regulator, anaerobic regulatory protein
MTGGIDMDTRPAQAAETAAAPLSPDPEAVFGAFATQASRLRLRRGQTVALTLDGHEAAFMVRSGALMLDLALPGTMRQVIDLLLPGDVVRSSFAPQDANARLVSVSATEVWRIRWSTLKRLAGEDPALTLFLETALAAQMARHAIHVATIGRLSGEQRVATVLTELALRSGNPAQAGEIAFDLPFSRRDIADYLGLNPDTLSRIISNLRKAGILARSERSRTVVRDFPALAALSPAARSLAGLYGSERGAPPIAR